MHTLTRLGAGGAAITVGLFPATMLLSNHAAADSNGATVVALGGILRRCDFSSITSAPWATRARLGSGSALIHTAGSGVVAEVHLADTPQPGTHYDVGLVQEPRPSSATCGPGDPGTTFTGLDTDAAGNGTVTIQDSVRQGTTGVWVIVERPNGNSQNPAEFYTSDFVAPV